MFVQVQFNGYKVTAIFIETVKPPAASCICSVVAHFASIGQSSVAMPLVNCYSVVVPRRQ
jgi:hypothetical protein